MYHNKIRELRAENLYPPARKSCSQPIEKSAPVSEEDGELICQKLLIDSENWDIVKQMWQLSKNYRRNCILTMDVSKILEKWPTYKYPYGYTLVSSYLITKSQTQNKTK